MDIRIFIEKLGVDFFTGVPDSQLKVLCDYLMRVYGISGKHIIPANEGNAAALAAGYFLATGRVPLVYMQNSGLGNITNPVASLLNEKVYGIPCFFVIGWRGEPGTHDEPQHVFQGEITLEMLRVLDIESFVVTKETTEEEFSAMAERAKNIAGTKKSAAFVIKKGALTDSSAEAIKYGNNNPLPREEIIRHITEKTKTDIIISTTGKASRELFEIREGNRQSHKYDFLTVGSMGHSSSVALGIALQKPKTKIWCIDGDGAALMHMGAMAVIGSSGLPNFVHIVINNESHETVGGMPTVAGRVNLCKIAEACGYESICSASDWDALDAALEKIRKSDRLTFLEIKASIGARSDLGRPTTTAKKNKEDFMRFLREECV